MLNKNKTLKKKFQLLMIMRGRGRFFPFFHIIGRGCRKVNVENFSFLSGIIYDEQRAKTYKFLFIETELRSAYALLRACAVTNSVHFQHQPAYKNFQYIYQI